MLPMGNKLDTWLMIRMDLAGFVSFFRWALAVDQADLELVILCLQSGEVTGMDCHPKLLSCFIGLFI